MIVKILWIWTQSVQLFRDRAALFKTDGILPNRRGSQILLANIQHAVQFSPHAWLFTQHTPIPKPPSSSPLSSQATVSCANVPIFPALALTLSPPTKVTPYLTPPHSVSRYFNDSTGVLPSIWRNTPFSHGHVLSSPFNDMPSDSGFNLAVWINYHKPKKSYSALPLAEKWMQVT